MEIEPEHLWDPDRLRKELGMKPGERVTSREHVAGMTSHATATTQREITVDSSPAIPRDILESGETPLLLILDEAQRLGETHPPPENLRGLVTSLLHGIHNGKLGRPVVFLTAGLGKTSRVFKSLGISRFEGDALAEMDPLSSQSERAVLSDWLIKEGRAQGEITLWLNAISRETYGWPQHILAYMKLAVKYLLQNGGVMTAEGLGKVITEGRERRDAYYERRAEGLDGDVCGILADILAPLSCGQSIYKRDIITP